MELTPKKTTNPSLSQAEQRRGVWPAASAQVTWQEDGPIWPKRLVSGEQSSVWERLRHQVRQRRQFLTRWGAGWPLIRWLVRLGNACRQKRLRRAIAWSIQVALLAGLLAQPGAVQANGPVPQGGEFRVNTYTTGEQRNSSVAMDADGDFVVVWQSDGQDGDSWGVYGQRYNSAGQAQGSVFQVDTYTTGIQWNPGVAMNADGEFVVVWGSDGQDGNGYGVYGQRYNSTGVAQGSKFQVNTYTTDNQDNPSVAIDADGDFVVIWQSFGQDDINDGVYGQRYNSAGEAQGSEFQVNTYTIGNQRASSVAMDADGDFVVVWQDGNMMGGGQDGSGYGVYGQRYNGVGQTQGSEFRVNTYTIGAQSFPSVAMDTDGDFVVVWQDSGLMGNPGQDGDGRGVYGQRYNSAGQVQGSEFRINTYTTRHQQSPSVAMDVDGDFVVAWQSGYFTGPGQDGDGYGIYGQRYNSVGQTQGSEFQVNTYTTDRQESPCVAMDTDGDFVVVWQSGYFTGPGQDGSGSGVYGQRYLIPKTVYLPLVIKN